MDDLITFLNHQYAEDERSAQAMKQATGDSRTRWDSQRLLADIAAKRSLLEGHGPDAFAVTWDMDGNAIYSVACATCRRDIDAEVWPCRHVRLLAQSYDGQPGYREEWRPAGDA